MYVRHRGELTPVVGELRDEAAGYVGRAEARGTPRRVAQATCLQHELWLISFGYVLLLVRLLVDASLRGCVADVDPRTAVGVHV